MSVHLYLAIGGICMVLTLIYAFAKEWPRHSETEAVLKAGSILCVFLWPLVMVYVLCWAAAQWLKTKVKL